MNSDNKPHEDEPYHFMDESKHAPASESWAWKILIVDPENTLHQFIEDSLKTIQYENANLHFLHAFTNDEAKLLINSIHDICIVIVNIELLNDKMNENFLDYIRHFLKNPKIRLLLHGKNIHSIQSWLIDYDVNDIREQSELTKNHFISTVITALKSYRQLSQIENDIILQDKITAAANRFIPQAFLRILKKDSIANINLSDHSETDISILFLDIRSFTTLSEFSTPTETFRFVNDCMGYLEPYIARNSGFIDKYIGDSILALFANKPDDAVKSGIEMITSLESYNLERIKKRQIPINVGIGINTGRVVIGAIGFHDRLECTVISDAVNVASRVEKLNKFLGTQLLISDRTFNNLNNSEQFHYRNIGKQQLHGKMQFHTIYEIFDTDPEDILILKEKTLVDFSDAVIKFQNGDFIAAKSLFKSIIAINRHDTVAKYFLQKIIDLES